MKLLSDAVPLGQSPSDRVPEGLVDLVTLGSGLVTVQPDDLSANLGTHCLELVTAQVPITWLRASDFRITSRMEMIPREVAA